MTTFEQVLVSRLRMDPGRPLVTFYDDDTGERTELSVTTYANWVAKTAGVLTDDLGLDTGDRVALATAPEAGTLVARYVGVDAVRLSAASLETLAIVAYRQPVTRGEIDAVRGVNSDSAVTTLLTRSLVAEVGRRETVGRPALLAVTPECLQYLGLRSLHELPPLPDPTTN